MTARLEALARELEAVAGRLRADDPEPDEAAALVERCAELAAQLGAELDARSRAASEASARPPDASAGPPDTQEWLL